MKKKYSVHLATGIFGFWQGKKAKKGFFLMSGFAELFFSDSDLSRMTFTTITSYYGF